MKTFEYIDQVYSDCFDLVGELQPLGKKGWQVVHISGHTEPNKGSTYYVILMKERIDTTDAM